MLPAIFGLVGVVVGALMNGGVAYWSAKRLAAKDRLVAARLVHYELAAIENDISVWREFRLVTDDVPLSTPQWEAHKTTLAGCLNSGEWASVSGAYAMIALLNSSLAGLHAGDAFSGEYVPIVGDVEEAVGAAIWSVKPFAEGWDPKDDREDLRARRRVQKALQRRQ